MYDRDIDSDTTEQSEYVNLSTWHTAFWTITSKEWSGLDQWRMNKWMLLIRFAVRSLFGILFNAASSSDSDAKEVEALVESQVKILEAGPLSPKERSVPDGLRLHVLDIWLDELKQAAIREPPATPGKKRRREDKDGGDSNGEDGAQHKASEGKTARKAKAKPSKTSPADIITFSSSTPPPKSEATTNLMNQLMQPIRALSKDALSRSVRTKAKDVVKEHDEDKETANSS
jgi:hypothetical protein